VTVRKWRFWRNALGVFFRCACPCPGGNEQPPVETDCTENPVKALLGATLQPLEGDLVTPFHAPIEMEVEWDAEFVFVSELPAVSGAIGAWVGSADCDGKNVEIQFACVSAFGGAAFYFKVVVDGVTYTQQIFTIVVDDPAFYAETTFGVNSGMNFPCEEEAPGFRLTVTELP
jgi:hypothetical protein